MVRSCPLPAAAGGALLALLVLTGCGSDDDGAAASPSTAASAGVAADESVGGSPSPSSTSGSADTSTEYVPASLDGPAQNVPKPVMPALAREESREGAQAFLDYWSDAMWYAYQTGDTSYARDIISPHCEACLTELHDVASVYIKGSWMIGGRPEIVIQERLIARAQDGVYKPRALYSSEGGKLVKDGLVGQKASPDSGDSTLVYMDFTEGEWVYITMAPIAGE